MEFRLSREDEYTAVRRLWGQAFGEEEPWTSWYFSKHYRADQTWVGVENGQVLAQAHLLPYRLMLRGSWRDAVYFVGVCVEENLRGTGIGRAVMMSALAQLKRTGVGISILQPRWPEFYRKLGWDFCYSRQRYSMPMIEANLMLPEEVSPAMVWTPDEMARAPLEGLYGAFVQSRHGYALRESKDWDKLLADHRGDGGKVGVISREGNPEGYVLYHIGEKLLRVREMAWRDPGVVDTTWKYLIEQGCGVDVLEWDDPSGDPGSVLYSGSRPEPFLMGRMTDIKSVLEAMEYPIKLSVETNLTITDSLAPWNHGTFHWSIRQGKGALSPLSTSDTAGLSLGIAALSQLLFGERPVRELLAAGTSGVYHEEELNFLEQIFPVCRNFISEYF